MSPKILAGSLPGSARARQFADEALLLLLTAARSGEEWWR